MCALRWHDVDLKHQVVDVRRALSQDEQGHWYESSTKTHQHRRIVLDPETTVLLAAHQARCETDAAALDATFGVDAFDFSLAPDHSTFLNPDTATQRYERMARRLGIKTTSRVSEQGADTLWGLTLSRVGEESGAMLSSESAQRCDRLPSPHAVAAEMAKPGRNGWIEPVARPCVTWYSRVLMWFDPSDRTGRFGGTVRGLSSRSRVSRALPCLLTRPHGL